MVDLVWCLVVSSLCCGFVCGWFVVGLLFVPVFTVLLLCWSTSSEHQKTARQEIAARDRSWGSRGGTMHGEEYADSEHMNKKSNTDKSRKSDSDQQANSDHEESQL